MLKGKTGMIGIHNLHHLCAEFVNLVRADDLQQASQLFSLIESEYEVVSEALHTYIHENQL